MVNRASSASSTTAIPVNIQHNNNNSKTAPANNSPIQSNTIVQQRPSLTNNDICGIVAAASQPLLPNYANVVAAQTPRFYSNNNVVQINAAAQVQQPGQSHTNNFYTNSASVVVRFFCV